MLLSLACRDPAPTAEGRATLVLDAGWSAAPWRAPVRQPGPLQLTTSFTLPADKGGAGSVLVLEGAWWAVDATLNGAALPGVTGGLAPVEVPVGPWLRAGENTLSLRITPPGPEVPALLHGGGLASSGWHEEQPDLMVAPRLELRPAEHVRTVAFPLEGDRVRPVATVAGAPPGSRVRFAVALDGEERATLGEAPVVDGVARAPAVRWPLDAWQPGAPALYLAQATLVGPDGAVLDHLARRTGALEARVAGGRLRVSGEALAALAVRVTHKDADLPGTFGLHTAGGANAVELHGELAPSAWLDQADELGLPVVLVPRCVGRANKGEPTEAILAEELQQDLRLVDHIAHHPSPVILATEGQDAASQKRRAGPPRVLFTEGLHADPLGRPVSQLDLPARVLRVGPPEVAGGEALDSCAQEGCRGAWLTEVTWRGPGTPGMWAQMAEATERSLLAGGAVGVTMPVPRPADRAGWAPAWAAVAKAVGAEAADTGPFRGPATVRVTGGRPGETVWAEAPGHPTVGAVLDAQGQATLSLWHAGAATVGGRAVVLEAGRWAGWRLVPGVVGVDLSGG